MADVIPETKDYLGMSDDDFLQAETPAVELSEADPQPAAPEVANAAEPVVAEPEPAAADPAVAEQGELALEQPAADKPAEPAQPAPAGAEPKPEAAPADPAAEKPAEQPVNFEDFFKQVMTPFKANGRTIELKTPEEAIRLMQMGAGYGRKIQEMQPHLKVLRMLEKHDLLDEGKLSFLIDVNQKNPDAVKKIIKDSGIDPLDLNMDDNVSYQPHNHAVTDAEVQFHSALTDLQNQTGGQETLKAINQTWDQESKAILWEEPKLLEVIQEQRVNGLYDQIAAEIDRQKLLGNIPQATPFLQAYKLAGDHLVATKGFKAPPIQPQPALQPQPQVIETRLAQPKPQVQNSDKARAASPTKAAPHKAATTVNPLEMADDDFLKQFNGRL